MTRSYRLHPAAAIALCVAGTAAAADAPRCTSQAVDAQTQTVTCTIVASRPRQSFTFTATFLGGHDDTRAALQATLDGVRDICEAPSKTSLFGEDGEVSLDCRMTIASPGTPRALAVTLTYGHAQYDRFRLVGE